MANRDYFPVYLETSLDTRLVTTISYEETAASLKRKIEAEHVVSFPVIGEITVQAVKTCREGIMYQLADSMPVSVLLSGVNGTLQLYVEAVTTNYKGLLGNGKVDQEENVLIRGRSEDLVVIKVPSIDKEVLVDPLHDSTEAASHLLNKTKKKKRKKNLSSEDTALRLEESRKTEANEFQGDSVQEEPGQKLQDSHCGAHASETKKSGSRKGDWNVSEGGSGEEFNKRKKQKKAKVPDPSKDANGSVGEPLSMKETVHEASWEKEKDISGKNLGQDSDSPEIPGIVNLMKPIIPNQVKYTPTEVITSTTVHPSPNGEAGGTNHNAQAKGDVNFYDQPDANQMPDQGREVSGDPTEEPNQSISNYGVAKLGEEQARRDDAKKGQSLQEATQVIDAVSGGVNREKKKHKKIKGFCSDVTSEVPLIKENEPQVEDNINVLEKKDSKVAEKPAEEIKQETHTSGMDEVVKEKSRKKHKKAKKPSSDTPCEVPPIRGDESEKADDKLHESNQLVDEEINSDLPLKSAEELKHDTHTSGMDEVVKEKSRKKCKKIKGPSSDISCEIPPIRGDESEKADDKVYKSSDQLVDKERNSEIPLKSAVGGGAEADNSLPCKFDKERLQPEISSPADEDIGFPSQLRQEAAMGDKEKLRNDVGFSKEAAHVTGGDHGVVSVEKRSRKKKKAANIEGLVEEVRDNKSGPERVNDAIFEGKTSNEAVDTNLVNITGRDPGVLSVEKRLKNNKVDTDGRGKKRSTAKENGSCKEIESNLNMEKEIRKEAGDAINSTVGDPVVACTEKRKHKKTKPAAIDASSQELSSTKNDSSKERMSSLLIENEASTEAGDAHVTKNAGDVDFPAPNCADPDDSMNKIVSGVLADLKERSLIPPDTQISEDAAPAMQLLASVAVDQQKAEQVSGVIVKTRKEKSNRGKPKEIGVTDKHGVTSLAEGVTQNAPTTPEKVQKSVDNFLVEKQGKEAFAEGIQTRDYTIFRTPAAGKINPDNLSLPKPTKQPSDATSPLKGTEVNKKIQNSSFSKDNSKFHTSLSNNVSKRDDKMKCLVADSAVMSDASTEDDEEVKSRQTRPMLAVRKVSNKRLDEKIDASRKNSAVFSSGAIFDDSASEASIRDESGSAYWGSPMRVKKKGRAMMSPRSQWKDEGFAEDDLPMSQEPTKPKKKVNLSSVLMSSSCYKKAKISASQSQAEDRDMIDVVFETQPDGFLKLI